ncbi:MAG: hypothetical protein KAS12_01560 [Candidatus Aenigmarchaeota archaeon]|nr:hypothetical protein [Candidatus Aenigmarchaeota archaeon]
MAGKTIEELLKDLTKNPEKIEETVADLSDNQIQELRKELNPYGKIVSNKDSNERFTCISHTNLKEDFMRQLLMTGIIGFINACIDEEKEMAEDYTAEECVAIKSFMQKYFQFDPNFHVKSAYKAVPEDTERGELTAEEKELIPPDDTFHRIRFYMDANYEKIRQATLAIYREKPDIELAFQVHGSFPTEEEAKEFQQQHSGEMITKMDVIKNGNWILTGPFKQNRTRMEFYNRENEILKQIIDHKAEEAKLGKELMEDRVSRGKEQNITEVGPDDPGLKKYSETNANKVKTHIARVETKPNSDPKIPRHRRDRKMIKKTPPTKEEIDQRLKERDLNLKLKEKKDQQIQDQTPDNGIAVQVFTTDGKDFNSSHFYSKEEKWNPEQQDQ